MLSALCSVARFVANRAKRHVAAGGPRSEGHIRDEGDLAGRGKIIGKKRLVKSDRLQFCRMAVVERTGEMPYTETADMDYTMAENSWFTDVRFSDVFHS